MAHRTVFVVLYVIFSNQSQFSSFQFLIDAIFHRCRTVHIKSTHISFHHFLFIEGIKCNQKLLGILSLLICIMISYKTTLKIFMVFLSFDLFYLIWCCLLLFNLDYNYYLNYGVKIWRNLKRLIDILRTCQFIKIYNFEIQSTFQIRSDQIKSTKKLSKICKETQVIFFRFF